jgi:hypothetical protein
LQPVKVFSRLDYNSCEANRRRRYIVILECLQRPCRGLLFCHNCIRRRKHLIEVARADELLQYRYMGMVRCIQSKALRERISEASVGAHRVLNHRRVGFERDVDRGHWIMLRDCALDDRDRQPSPDGRKDPQMVMHVPPSMLVPTYGWVALVAFLTWCQTTIFVEA